MAVTARISKAYRIRLGAMAALLLAFSGWFFYDGAIGYPEQQRVFELWEDLRENHPEWRAEWNQLMNEHGYPANPDGKSELDIFVQYLLGVITGGLGLLFLFGFVRTFGRWVAADDEALTANGGHRAAFDRIESVDTERWDRKGIAIVHYRDGAGQPRRITLDDWKFDREATQAIYQQLQGKLGQGDGEADGEAQGEASAVESQRES